MQICQFGPKSGSNLVCLFGWGNRLAHDTVRWLVDRFASAGYRVHAIELPLHLSDFYDDYLRPIEAYVETLESYRFVAHSTGGLIAAYLTGAETETYLSPWWGFREADSRLGSIALDLLSLVPVSRRIVPKTQWTRADLGTLTTDSQLADSPNTIAPTFVREARLAQRERPPIPDDAVVFCTLTDSVVSVRAIGEGVPATRTVLYDGGHELFSSPCREDSLATLLAVVDAGAAGR